MDSTNLCNELSKLIKFPDNLLEATIHLCAGKPATIVCKTVVRAQDYSDGTTFTKTYKLVEVDCE